MTEAPQDRPELIGGKAAHLARGHPEPRTCRCPPALSSPPGLTGNSWSTTTWRSASTPCWRPGPPGEQDERQVSRQIQYSILAGVVPHEVAGEVRRQAGKGDVYWAVRSSAYGEDGELSFAGLHDSLLQVPARGILKAYKQVLASLYSPEALVYRQKMGMLGEEAAMAVLCQEMIPAGPAG